MKPRRPSNLPRGWSKHIKSSLVHAIALAATALTEAWSRAAAGCSKDTRVEAELDRAKTEVAMLREESITDDLPPELIPETATNAG